MALGGSEGVLSPLSLEFLKEIGSPLVKGGVAAPPAKNQWRAGPKAGARHAFTGRRTSHVHLPAGVLAPTIGALISYIGEA